MSDLLSPLLKQLLLNMENSDTEGAVKVLAKLTALFGSTLAYQSEAIEALKVKVGYQKTLCYSLSARAVELDVLMEKREEALLNLTVRMEDNEYHLNNVMAAVQSLKPEDSPAGSAILPGAGASADDAADDNGGKPMKQN
jgi:uncharacterized coiled-coil protein SlyX